MSSKSAERWLHGILLSLAFLLCAARFAFLRADFPDNTPWLTDQAKFTDEGWWASAAVRHFLIGHWQVPGDYNPAAVVPMWPLLLTVVFHFTGVSLTAARSLSVVFSIATVALVYLLVRRYGGTGWESSAEVAAALAAVLLAASPFAFAFSRLATLDTVVAFEFCLLLWLASHAGRGRTWILLALGSLIPVMLLTKTTAAALLPAVLWILWRASGKKRAVVAVAALAGAAMGVFVFLVTRSRYGGDYQYFYDINALADIEWRRTGALLHQLLNHGLWVDRVLYPCALAVLLLSLLWLRRLWRNPLFTAAWLALVGQAIYILRRQDDYAPRYFLAMLVPFILILALTLQMLRPRHRPLAATLAAALAVALLLDTGQVIGFLRHRQYRFYDAAQSIRAIVDRNRSAHRLLLGVSGDQLSLMMGVPAINDEYSSQDLEQKVQVYPPGWYIGWNDLDQDVMGSLTAFRLDKVAVFRVFDNEQRNLLTLYRMVPKKESR